MAVVAGGKQGLGLGRALALNGSGGLEKLHKDASEKAGRDQQQGLQPRQQSRGAPFLRSIKPNTWAPLPGERRVEVEGCNFRGLQDSASKGAEMLLGLGAVVLGGRKGVGGCPGTPRKERKTEAQEVGEAMGPAISAASVSVPSHRSPIPSVGVARALTGRDDVPRTQQLQVREDVNEVGYARVAVDPGPQDAGRALPRALTQSQLGLVTHD
jgi:hypothetical protein